MLLLCACVRDPSIAVQPADSRQMVFETVQRAEKLWIKGNDFSIHKLLGSAHATLVISRCSHYCLPSFETPDFPRELPDVSRIIGWPSENCAAIPQEHLKIGHLLMTWCRRTRLVGAVVEKHARGCSICLCGAAQTVSHRLSPRVFTGDWSAEKGALAGKDPVRLHGAEILHFRPRIRRL